LGQKFRLKLVHKIDSGPGSDSVLHLRVEGGLVGGEVAEDLVRRRVGPDPVLVVDDLAVAEPDPLLLGAVLALLVVVLVVIAVVVVGAVVIVAAGAVVAVIVTFVLEWQKKKSLTSCPGMAAWSSGIVSVCHRREGAMGREIESRQGIHKRIAIKQLERVAPHQL
jgi:hypothetical protein